MDHKKRTQHKPIVEQVPGYEEDAEKQRTKPEVTHVPIATYGDDPPPTAAGEHVLVRELEELPNVHAVQVAAAEVQHVRLGGQAGVRVRDGGLMMPPKRVGQDENDHQHIPRAVLAQVRDLLIVPEGATLTAAEQAVRDLLAPWL
jgi:hypothetical protein